VAIFFLFSFEGGGTERTTCFLPILFVSFLLAICVHSFVGEVDSGVLRVSGPSAPSLLEAIFFRSAGGCAFPCFTLIFSEVVGGDFLLGGSAMRCRVPSSSATDEMVPKQNVDPGRKTILCWKVTAIELAWIGDTPLPGAPAIGVLGPTAHPGLPLKVFFRSRTVLPTIARWFVQGARETVNNGVQVWAA
jgi:hypothetical protein